MIGHRNLGITSIHLQGIDYAEIIEAVHSRRAPMITRQRIAPALNRQSIRSWRIAALGLGVARVPVTGRRRTRERHHSSTKHHIDLLAAGDEFPKWPESLCI